MIELRTLGGLELRDERGGDLCGKLQPKRLALLIYLAHAPRRFHRRDSLMALFWPELDTGGARNSLRQSLYELRRTLGKGVLEGRGYEEIAVVERFLWSDAVAFDLALGANHAERALELYRGDLLEGFHVQN
ncbi:MAG TPA: winged helix-turn-helix domain-containing protein, partial [Gemmatimonadota bacterium]|nr:winged helix-turn-helix domain-containing protein [Gemmatimonadota bacterium]